MIFSDISGVKAYIITIDQVGFNRSKKMLSDLGFKNLHKWNANTSIEDVSIELSKMGVSTLKFENFPEMSCAFSHIQIMKELLDSEDEYRLIFEDDVEIHTKFHFYFSQLQDLNIKKYDILFLGGWVWGYKCGDTNIGTIDEIKNIFGNYKFLENCYSYETHAYLINRSFAEKTLQYYNDYSGFKLVIDNFYVDCVNRRIINSCILGNRPIDSENLDILKIRNRNNCGLIYQSRNLKSKIQNQRYIEKNILESQGEWLKYKDSEIVKYDYKFSSTDKLVSPITYRIGESGILKLPNGMVDKYGLTKTDDYIIPELSWIGSRLERDNIQTLRLNKVVEITSTEPVIKIGGRGLNLHSMFSDINFGHYVFDFLTKIEIVENILGIPLNDFDSIIIPNANFDIHQSILQYLNLEKTKILNIVDKQYKFDELYSVSLMGGPRISRNGSFEYIKKMLKLENGQHKNNIYIKRENKSRPIYNLSQLEQLLEECGFITVDPSICPDNIELFNNANIIIGVHGAGLTNCIFSTLGTTLIELMPENHIYPYYMSMADANYMNYFSILCRYDKRSASCYVDIENLTNILKELL